MIPSMVLPRRRRHVHYRNMQWVPILSAVIGAAIALSGSVLAEARRDRAQRDRDREQDLWQTCLDFALCVDQAHSALREVTRFRAAGPETYDLANTAVHGAGVYAVRERLLMSAATDLAAAGEDAFLRLVDIRNVIREGAGLQSAEYHRTYHAFADSLWRYRSAARSAFGHRPLTPAALNRPSWSELEACQQCTRAAA